MSETIETAVPQDGGAPAPEPAAAPAPGDEGAATEGTDNADETAEPESERRPSRTDRRIVSLRARLTAGEAERARMAAELEHYRRQLAPPQPDRPPSPEDIPRLVEQQVAEKLALRVAQDRAEKFHTEGQTAFADWQDRCQSLMAMGADAAFAELLLEIPNGARVAGALSDDPEQMEAIAGLKTERARAIALGRFAAALEAKPVPAARQTSRAPAPIRPIAPGTRVEFNEYLETDGARLADHYARQALERRRGR